MTVTTWHPSAGPIIACDQRTSFMVNGVVADFSDGGGRLQRHGNGWITGIGSASYASAALEAMAGQDCADLDVVSRVLRETASRFHQGSPEMAATLIDATVGFHTHFTVASGAGVARIDWDGKVLNAGKNFLFVSYPLKDPIERANLQNVLTADLMRLETPTACVRRIAAEFAAIATRVNSVSPTCEIAVGARFLEGRSSTIATYSDKQMVKALRPAPTRRFAGFDSLVERMGKVRVTDPAREQMQPLALSAHR